jgi:hypothetical protein
MSMTWNHRVVREVIFAGDEVEETFKIHEVFYNDTDGTIMGYSEESVAPFGTDVSDLKSDYAAMGGAFGRPVLDKDILDLLLDPDCDEEGYYVPIKKCMPLEVEVEANSPEEALLMAEEIVKAEGFVHLDEPQMLHLDIFFYEVDAEQFRRHLDEDELDDTEEIVAIN